MRGTVRFCKCWVLRVDGRNLNGHVPLVRKYVGLEIVGTVEFHRRPARTKLKGVFPRWRVDLVLEECMLVGWGLGRLLWIV